MFLHTLFFPNYLPLTDFSVLETYMFSVENPSFSDRFNNSNNSLLNNSNIILEKEEPKLSSNLSSGSKTEEEEKSPIIEEEPKLNRNSSLGSKIEKKIESNTLFHVKNVQDELFWLVFVSIYGETEYFRNKYNYGKVEIQEKQKIAEKIQDAAFTKKMKWKWTKIQKIEMISDLINTPRMPIAIFNAIAAYYECKFILVDSDKKVYLSYDGIPCQDSLEKTYIIYVHSKPGSKTLGKERKEFSLDIQPSLQTIQKIQDEYFELEHYEHALKAISNYKKIELDTIAVKIRLPGLPVGGEKTSKTEVYDRLRLYLSDSIILQC